MIDVLVVDDDEAVLEGLEHQLRPLRDQWRLRFALGGPAALAALDGHALDVVISDMRMPKVDGMAVLERARHLHPDAIRLILSGEVGPSSLDRVLTVAHQVLAKPCPPPRLRATVERALAVRAAVHDPTVRALVAGVGELPPTPRLWVKLGRMLERAEAGAAAIAEVLAEDPALTARLIRLAGTMTGGASRVSSVVDAVRVLGTDALRAMVLALEVSGRRADPALDRIYAHGLRTAYVARALAKPADSDAAFAAGVMHDLGAVVLTLAQPAQAAARRDRALRLKQPLIEAVALHHSPDLLPSELGLAGLVYVAAALVDAGVGATLDPAFVARAGLADEVARWRRVARPYLESP